MSEAESVQRYKLTLAYRGTRYHGWQRQVIDDGSDLPTVQNVLRLALARVVKHPVNITGSSRTDAGVHARGQVAHLDTIRTQIPPENLMRAVNAKLPADVVVRSIDAVDAEFDAIQSTLAKGYRYVVHNAAVKDPFASDVALFLPDRPRPLEAVAMNDAGARLVGTHDFASFCKPGHGRETTVRTITACTVMRENERIFIDVAGTGFLWNQVRIIAGTLLRVGSGHITPASIDDVLAAKLRTAAGPTAPAHGLFLEWIRYDSGARVGFTAEAACSLPR